MYPHTAFLRLLRSPMGAGRPLCRKVHSPGRAIYRGRIDLCLDPRDRHGHDEPAPIRRAEYVQFLDAERTRWIQQIQATGLRR